MLRAVQPLRSFALVALGGSLGAMARFGVAELFARRMVASHFPWATLFINLSGCFLIALFLGAAATRPGLSEGWRYLFPIGFVGAYTTFSTYEWEMLTLSHRAAFLPLALYFVASNALGFAAVAAGNALGRNL